MMVDCKFNAKKSELVAKEFINLLNKGRIEQKKPPYNFSDGQFRVIKEAFYYGLKISQVEKFAYPYFNEKQMDQIFMGLFMNEDISLYNDPKFDYMQMRQIRAGVSYGLPKESIMLYANEDFDGEQMKWIRVGLQDLGLEKTKLYLDKKFSSEQMKQIAGGFLDKLSYDNVSKYAKVEIPAEKMGEIRFKMFKEQYSD